MSCSPVLYRDGVYLNDIGQVVLLNDNQRGVAKSRGLYSILIEGAQHFPQRLVN